MCGKMYSSEDKSDRKYQAETFFKVSAFFYSLNLSIMAIDFKKVRLLYIAYEQRISGSQPV